MVLYQQCLQRFGHKHRFMAFIDSDEVRSVTGPAIHVLPPLHDT